MAMSFYDLPAGSVIDVIVGGMLIMSRFGQFDDICCTYAIWDPDSGIVAYIDSTQWSTRNQNACDHTYAKRNYYEMARIPQAESRAHNHRILLPHHAQELEVFNIGSQRIYVYEFGGNAWVTITHYNYSGRTVLRNVHTPGSIERMHCDTEYVYISLCDCTLWKVPLR